MKLRTPSPGLCALAFVAMKVISLTSLHATTISMNDPAILYSPFNWGVTAQSAKSINSGAYFKVLFSGTSCTLTTDTSGDSAPYSEFWARVDGGPFAEYTLAAGNPGFSVATALPNRKHILEVVIKSTTETKDRWVSQQTAVVFTGLVLDAGAGVSAPVRKPFNILIYGDSITEGVLVNGPVGANDTDHNDAVKDYSWLLSQEIPAEVGVVGFGATGLTRGGSGSVPALGSSYDHLWSGQVRSFTSPAPDLILYNEGTNDGGSNIAPGMTAVVTALQVAAPDARQLLLLPFNGTHAADLKAVVASVASAKITFGDTTGFFYPADASDGLHPYGYSHIAFIAPQMARLVAPLLQLPPIGVAATESNGTVTLNWIPVSNATGYNVKRSANSGGPYKPIGPATAATYTDTTGVNGTVYYYVVSAQYGSFEGVNSSQVNATVQISFSTFQQHYFTAQQLGDPAVSGPLADPSNSGVNNLLAYAFNLSPWTATAANLPAVQDAAGQLTLAFTRRKAPTDLAYAVEVSTDLRTWNSGPSYTTELSAVPLDQNTDRVTVGDNALPAPNNPEGYMRLTVSH